MLADDADCLPGGAGHDPATVWWWLSRSSSLGRYSPAFLDYIENAPITSTATGLGDVIGGHSDWVAYASVTDWRAGNLLGTTPFLLLDAAALAALGFAGICRRDNPHARFLLAGLLAGVVLVSFGYAGSGLVDGWWAGERQALLDGALAPLRNLHKFDLVLRLPLVLGMVHFVSVFRLGVGQLRRVATLSGDARWRSPQSWASHPRSTWPGLAPAGAFEEVPGLLARRGRLPQQPRSDDRPGSCRAGCVVRRLFLGVHPR